MWFDRYLEEGYQARLLVDGRRLVQCDPVGWPQVGTWEVDAKRFPHGLRAISDHVHSKGVKTLVWFEPERVTADTWLAETHPEWVLGGAKGGLLNWATTRRAPGSPSTLTGPERARH